MKFCWWDVKNQIKQNMLKNTCTPDNQSGIYASTPLIRFANYFSTSNN